MNQPPATPHLSAHEDHVGLWLRFVSNHVSGEFRTLVEQNGVSLSEWGALREMARHPPSGAADWTKSTSSAFPTDGRAPLADIKRVAPRRHYPWA